MPEKGSSFPALEWRNPGLPFRRSQKKSTTEESVALSRRLILYPQLLDEMNGLFDVLMSLVNVFEGALLQSLREGVVFFLGNIAVCLVDQFQRAVKPAGPIHAGVNRRMIVQVLAVVDAGLFDFVDRFIDFMDGFLLLFLQLPAVRALQVRSGVTQVGQGVKVSRMLSGRLRLCHNKGRHHESQGKNNNEHRLKSLHRA